MHNELVLERWANPCVIMAAAAATLLGLLFVVITVAAERRPDEGRKIRLYLTPIIFFLATVLVLATALTFPTHTTLSIALSSGLVGGLGLSYLGSLGLPRGGVRYEGRSVIVYLVLPAMAYALMIAGGVIVQAHAQRGLAVIAGALLALLTLAVRNAWAVAIEVVKGPRNPS